MGVIQPQNPWFPGNYGMPNGIYPGSSVPDASVGGFGWGDMPGGGISLPDMGGTWGIPNGSGINWGALLAGAGGGASAYLLSKLLSGGGSSSGDKKDGGIRPEPGLATWPNLQNNFGQWLFGQVGKGMDPYPGQLNAALSKTILPNVYANWQPWNTGNSMVASWLDNFNKNGAGLDPRYSQIQQWGGAGGPGNQAMSLMMQYGAPSAGIGKLMESYAQGYPQYGGAHLAQFLTKPVRR